MEFLGRRDHQVKIRGFRVELGEIEAKLNEHPAIEKALITTVGGTKTNRQIAAYYMSNQEQVAIEDLYTHLGESLPEYMIPAFFVRLDEFPLNANGKIDRKQLPDPNESMSVAESFAEAQTEMETQVLDIWKELLQLERISTRDNFFQIGGNSLLAAQLVARIREQTQLAIRLGMIFTNPTIQSLAAHMEDLQLLMPDTDTDLMDNNEILI